MSASDFLVDSTHTTLMPGERVPDRSCATRFKMPLASTPYCSPALKSSLVLTILRPPKLSRRSPEQPTEMTG
jgi:hypothetical protein